MAASVGGRALAGPRTLVVRGRVKAALKPSEIHRLGLTRLALTARPGPPPMTRCPVGHVNLRTRGDDATPESDSAPVGCTPLRRASPPRARPPAPLPATRGPCHAPTVCPRHSQPRDRGRPTARARHGDRRSCVTTGRTIYVQQDWGGRSSRRHGHGSRGRAPPGRPGGHDSCDGDQGPDDRGGEPLAGPDAVGDAVRVQPGDEVRLRHVWAAITHPSLPNYIAIAVRPDLRRLRRQRPSSHPLPARACSGRPWPPARQPRSTPRARRPTAC